MYSFCESNEYHNCKVKSLKHTFLKQAEKVKGFQIKNSLQLSHGKQTFSIYAFTASHSHQSLQSIKKLYRIWLSFKNMTFLFSHTKDRQIKTSQTDKESFLNKLQRPIKHLRWSKSSLICVWYSPLIRKIFSVNFRGALWSLSNIYGGANVPPYVLGTVLNDRSGRTEVFCKTGVVTKFAKFTGKDLYQSLFLIKLQLNFI